MPSEPSAATTLRSTAVPYTTPQEPLSRDEVLTVFDDAIASAESVGMPFTVGQLRLVRDWLRAAPVPPREPLDPPHFLVVTVCGHCGKTPDEIVRTRLPVPTPAETGPTFTTEELDAIDEALRADAWIDNDTDIRNRVRAALSKEERPSTPESESAERGDES